MRVLMIAITSLLVLTGCGQKGPLYLPQDPAVDTAPVKQSEKPRQDPSEN